MSKNDPSGKQHPNFTKTTSQKARHGTYDANESSGAGGGSIDVPTPTAFLTGLSGINRAASKSNSKNFGTEGSGGTPHVRAQRPGVDGGKISLKPSPSYETRFGQ